MKYLKIDIKIPFILIGVFATIYFSNLYGQRNFYGVTIEPNAGFLLAHRTTMGHLPKEHVYGINIGGVFHSKGTHQWHHDFNFPEFDLVFTFMNLGNQDILGYGLGIGGGVYLPFFRKKGWSFGTNLRSELGFVSKKYDVIKNPKNNAIGSHLNYLISIGFRAEKQFKNNALGINFRVNHLSNGALKMPNLGLNIPFLGIHYTHYFSEINYQTDSIIERSGQKVNTWQFFTQLAMSSKQIYPAGGKNFGVVALNNYFHYKAMNKFIVEGGVDLIYNQSIIREVGQNDRSKNIQLGTYAAYVLSIHKFEFVVGMGVYLYNPASPLGPLYHKFGARIQLYDRLWGSIIIKSHWFKADYFEYGISYRW